MHCKASDTALLTQFLAAWLNAQWSRGVHLVLLGKSGLTRDAARLVMDYAGSECQELCKYFGCVDTALEALAKAPWLFLEPATQAVCYANMFNAICSYQRLHTLHPTKFKAKPKVHAVCHLVLDLNKHEGLACPNFWADCCWMDEDFIGRVCRRLVRHVSPQNVLRAVVERYATLMHFEVNTHAH